MASGQQGSNANALLWDTDTRAHIFQLEEHDRSVQHLAFSPDDRLLVSVGSAADGKIIFWDVATGCVVARAAQACPYPAHRADLASESCAQHACRQDSLFIHVCLQANVLPAAQAFTLHWHPQRIGFTCTHQLRALKTLRRALVLSYICRHLYMPVASCMQRYWPMSCHSAR